jgi:hypothetical protein
MISFKNFKKRLDKLDNICYNIDNERRKDAAKMMRFTVEHKYCGMQKEIEGFNVLDALKTNGLDYTIWIVKSVEKI